MAFGLLIVSKMDPKYNPDSESPSDVCRCLVNCNGIVYYKTAQADFQGRYKADPQ